MSLRMLDNVRCIYRLCQGDWAYAPISREAVELCGKRYMRICFGGASVNGMFWGVGRVRLLRGAGQDLESRVSAVASVIH